MDASTAIKPPVGRYVIPGDQVFQLPESGVVRVGTGLRDDGTQLIASRPGLLQQSKDGKLWVFGRQKRYIPSVDDAVLGVVTSKFSEYYEIDIAAPFSGLLPVLAFEGATRRNRPNLKEGDLVYCRVDMADRDLQPTVTCMDGAGRGAGFGLLQGGYVLETSNAYSRILVTKPPPAVLAALGRSLQFELAVGVNGKIWIAAPTQQATILVAQALQECEREPSKERAEGIVAGLMKTYQRGIKERETDRMHE
ncbi:hypothetical protein Ndes2526B_g03701 [Nannochloris sp. 'desiccata']